MNIETFFNDDNAKRFFFPGKIFIGKGMAAKAAELVAQHDSVAIIIDRAFSDSALHQNIRNAVATERSVSWVVQGPPYVQDVMAFIGQMGEVPAVIVSIGGGSAADFAKAVILHELFGTVDGVGVGERRGLLPRPDAKRPAYVAIPTTAGSGAESSRYYVNYDKYTHGKVYGKTWTTVADWVLLDPELLSTMPTSTLVACAFDAFVHLFETFIAQHERSNFGDMFSLDGIPRIMAALDTAVFNSVRDDKTHEELLYAATMAGMAISNVRTGNIHEAAGALLELTDLSHPETLFVFFREAIEQYLDSIRDREALLLSHLRLIPAFSGFSSMDDVIRWWEEIFAEVGLVSRIKISVSALSPSLERVRDHVFQRIYSDKVWITKESPLALDEGAIRELIDRSLARFGVAE